MAGKDFASHRAMFNEERNDPTNQSVYTTILYIARSREKAGEFSEGEGREAQQLEGPEKRHE